MREKKLKGIIGKGSHKIVDETHGLFTSVKSEHFFAQLRNFLTLNFNTFALFLSKTKFCIVRLDCIKGI